VHIPDGWGENIDPRRLGEVTRITRRRERP
jgi:hypothetical protein